MCNRIENHFNAIFQPRPSRSEFELTHDIVLHKLFGYILAVIGRTLEFDTVSKMLFDKQYRSPLLFLIPERGQSSGIDKCAFLGKVVAEIGEDFALFVFNVARYPKILLESYLFVPPDILIIPYAIGATGDHLGKGVIPPLVVHHRGNGGGKTKQVYIHQTGQFIERFNDMGYLVRISDYTSLSFLAIKRFYNMHIIVQHHEVAEVSCHPIALGDKPYNVIGMGDNLAIGIVVPINLFLTFGHTDYRIIDKSFGKDPIVPFMGGYYDFEITHFLSPSSAILTSLTSTTLLLLTFPVL